MSQPADRPGGATGAAADATGALAASDTPGPAAPAASAHVSGLSPPSDPSSQSAPVPPRSPLEPAAAHQGQDAVDRPAAWPHTERRREDRRLDIRRLVDRRQGQRRGNDRRASDRRAAAGAAADGAPSTSFDSWLSPWTDVSGLGAGAFGGASGSGSPGARPGGDGSAAGTLKEAPRQRILRTYLAARAALGVVLLLLPWAAMLWTGGRLMLPLLIVSLVYATQSLALWWWRGRAQQGAALTAMGPARWWWTIGADLLAFTLLRVIDPTPQFNLSALLVLPVLMAGLLTSRKTALGTAAAVTLVLLASAWAMSAGEADMLLQLSQAGLSGAGMFLAALLASEMALRLAGEERSARDSLALARQQTQLNRVVIEEMTEGVLVVDRDCGLRAVNPAGRALLGDVGKELELPCAMAEWPALAGLQRSLQQAFSEGQWPEAAREQLLAPAEGEARAVQVRARFTRRRDIAADGTLPEDICVLFLEDLRVVRARQQQDKLAAMGRVSAGIAHEIRNPLAAIAQANALLQEDRLNPGQARLTSIVADNVARLKRIVDDVMAVAPGANDQRIVIDASAAVASATGEWRRTAAPELRAADRLVVQLPTQPLRVLFDPEHLRRVLVNLLDNAARHSGPAPGAVQLELARVPTAPLVRLSVASDGEPVAPEIERHLFEPFFSTRSRGSGLGLYICRELCERHGASIEFRRGPASLRHRNVFSVVMRAAAE